MGDGTLWGLVDRDRVAVPIAVLCATLSVCIVVGLVTLLFSVAILGSIAAERKHEAQLERSQAWNAAMELSLSMPTSEDLAAGDAWYQARIREIDARERAPLPVILVLSCVLTLTSAAAALSATVGDRLLVNAAGAHSMPQGEFGDSKHALTQVAIAAGLASPPRLLLIDSGGLNAFYIARPNEARYAICLTRGVTELDVDEQMAIIANLIARGSAHRSAWLTSVACIVGVGWMFLRLWDGISNLVRGRTAAEEVHPAVALAVLGALPFLGLALWAQWDTMVQGGIALGVPLAMVLPVFVIGLVTLPPLAVGVTLAQSRDAEFGDAEGLLLTKNPAGTLRALQATSESSTDIGVPNQFGHLCWAWPGSGEASFGSWSIAYRNARIKSVLGAAQVMESAES